MAETRTAPQKEGFFVSASHFFEVPLGVTQEKNGEELAEKILSEGYVFL